MKIRLECPLNFLSKREVYDILNKRSLTIESENPEIIVVNPGTDSFLDYNYFRKYRDLKYILTPSTGTNHLDVNDLSRTDDGT